jgi:hypothetical protein
MTRDSLRRAATAQAATPEERAEDERNRFVAANVELAHLTVRQGYALRVLRGAALALVGAVGERDRAEAAAAHDDTGEQARARAVAQTAVQAAFTALHEALDNSEEDAKAAEAAHQQLVAERDRLQRACDEGLPREAIFCPACGKRHVDGANGEEFARRPHHTHLCQFCGNVWGETLCGKDRWSFGVAEGEESPGTPAEHNLALINAGLREDDLRITIGRLTKERDEALDFRAWADTLSAASKRLGRANATLRTLVPAEGGAEGQGRPIDVLAALASLKPLASRAYRTITLPAGVDRAKHLAEPIRPDFDADNDEAPRLVLAFDLGGMIPAEGSGPTPWQASVEYEGGMGAVPVIAGNACATPAEAMDSLRAELEAEDARQNNGDDEGSDD